VFPNYTEYTNSDIWKKVKSQQLMQQPDCECCWNPAVFAHHLTYNIEPWTEQLWLDIVSVCSECHNRCHYIDWVRIHNSFPELSKRFDQVKLSFTDNDIANEIERIIEAQEEADKEQHDYENYLIATEEHLERSQEELDQHRYEYWDIDPSDNYELYMDREDLANSLEENLNIVNKQIITPPIDEVQEAISNRLNDTEYKRDEDKECYAPWDQIINCGMCIDCKKNAFVMQAFGKQLELQKRSLFQNFCEVAHVKLDRLYELDRLCWADSLNGYLITKWFQHHMLSLHNPYTVKQAEEKLWIPFHYSQ